MKKGKILFITAAVLIAALGSIPFHVLQIDVLREERPVFVRIVRPGNEFALGYIHSVELSPVWDYFRVDDSYRMILYETTIRSFNTGLPSTLTGEERLHWERDGFRISGMNRVLPVIDLWVHERTDNTLKVVGIIDPLKLYSLAGNTLLRISIRKTTVGSYLYLKAYTTRVL
ncbi:MAG: DUF1850 domain-containing protein [Deltaproteobacteria bacterium]|nr:DUF1850 domain-containing protein [Deltaproteobacteria bacterium]